MTQKVVPCYILDRNHKITIDLCETNTIYDKSGSHEVPFDLLTFDHLRKLIWSDIKSNEEDINGAKQLKLWLGEKSKELEKKFRDGVYVELDPTDKLSTNIFQSSSIIIVQPPQPATTGKCLPMVYLMLILYWFTKFKSSFSYRS